MVMVIPSAREVSRDGISRPQKRGGGAIALLAQGDPPRLRTGQCHVKPGPATPAATRRWPRRPSRPYSQTGTCVTEGTRPPPALWRRWADPPLLTSSLWKITASWWI